VVFAKTYCGGAAAAAGLVLEYETAVQLFVQQHKPVKLVQQSSVTLQHIWWDINVIVLT